MRLKQNQLVYFYRRIGEYEGAIVSGNIIEAKKDLLTGKIVYTVKTPGYWWISETCELEADQIYTNKKKAEKEWKDEIVYGKLLSRIDDMEQVLNQIYGIIHKEKIETEINLETTGNQTISTAYIQADTIKLGELDVKQEIDKLKKDVESIKKNFKKKTKKPYEKRKNQ
jgi:hypothetical protein